VQTPKFSNRYLFAAVGAGLVACSVADTVSAPPLAEADAAVRAVTAGYTVVQLTTFPGDVESFAVDVNDAGIIVGSGQGTTRMRGYVSTGSNPIPLSDASIFSRGLAISNSSPLYAAGDYAYDGNSHPARWTIDPVAGTATVFSLGSGFGFANGINDAGAAVGVSDQQPVIWDETGTPTIVTPPVANTFTSGEGRDINNAGIAVINFTGPSFTRTYLRINQDVMIELPPLAGDVSTFGRRVSEVTGTQVYVAGTSYQSDRAFHAMRWTVDLASNTIINTESRAETSSASDVSTSGAMSGALQGHQNDTPFLWRTTGLFTLSVPKGGGSADASGISDNGNYVVGQAFFRLHRRALLWTSPTP
jgi:uncharacterized membrane protein